MTNVFSIDLKELSSKLQKGKVYNIYTLYRELPINIKAPLSWIDTSKANEVYLAFNWKDIAMKHAFQNGSSTYIKISVPYYNRELSFYIECDVFSSRKEELVLMTQSVLEVPPFLKRASVRVELDSKHEAHINLCVEDEDEHIKDYKKRHLSRLALKDISESGFAIKIKKDEEKSDIALDMLKDLAQEDPVFDVELCIDSNLMKAKTHIANIYERPTLNFV